MGFLLDISVVIINLVSLVITGSPVHFVLGLIGAYFLSKDIEYLFRGDADD